MTESDEDLFSEPTHHEFVGIENPYMKMAKEYAKIHSLDKTMPTGAVIVKNKVMVGFGANGSNYHDLHVCERVRLKIPTGQGYELCEGCHPKNHAESRAIMHSNSQGIDTKGTDMYLWGHWWLCRWCRENLEKAGINNVFLLMNAEVLFNKTKKNNVVGRQFED